MGKQLPSIFLQTKRYAVVTGANRGIGLEICRQLASNGITVVLTARDEKRGLEAVEKLKESGFSCRLEDVADPVSFASLAGFVKSQFGKLDILVNNAGVSGVKFDSIGLTKAFEDLGTWPAELTKELSLQNFEMAEECLKINYYGTKRMIEEHISLLELSDSPRIVNVSSLTGLLENIQNEQVKTVLNDIENLTEEKIDDLINKFKKDFESGSLEEEGWQSYLSARLMARKYPNVLINSVCPGYVRTDINCHTGLLSPTEGAQSDVRLALLASNEPSGLFYIRDWF